VRCRGDDPVGKIGNVIAKDRCHVYGNVFIDRHISEDSPWIGDGGLNVSQCGGRNSALLSQVHHLGHAYGGYTDMIAVSDRGVYEGGSRTPKPRIGEKVPERSMSIGDRDDHSEIGARKIREHLRAILIDLLG
jgi:hypothetical protein